MFPQAGLFVLHASVKILKQINNNQIEEIPFEIKYLTKLTHFNCANNFITELPLILFQLNNLIEFNCSNNNISIIPTEIGQLHRLLELYFDCNQVSELPSQIGQLTSLRNLNCSNNNISIIPPEIGNLIELRTFQIHDNNVAELPIELINCRALNKFYFSNNMLEYIPPQIQRWLDSHKTSQSIYDDSQSVHNYHIQIGVLNAINYITKNKPRLNADKLKIEILNNQVLSIKTKEALIEYCNDKTIHSVFKITFEELLISVFDFILNHESKEDILKVLNEEMSDSICKCFTGRMSRLINTLNGYDKNINITISDNEQIGNVCAQIRKQCGDNEELFKQTARIALKERGYPDAIIDGWLD